VGLLATPPPGRRLGSTSYNTEGFGVGVVVGVWGWGWGHIFT